jgi:hypothetical protein
MWIEFQKPLICRHYACTGIVIEMLCDRGVEWGLIGTGFFVKWINQNVRIFTFRMKIMELGGWVL